MNELMKRTPTVREIPFSADAAVRFQQLAGQPYPVLLDSCRHRGSLGRWDIMASNPVELIVARGNKVQRTRFQGHCGKSTAAGAGTAAPGTEHSAVLEETCVREPLPFLREVLREYAVESCDLPFCGGALGYFGYDLGREIERIADGGNTDLGVPDMVIGIYDWAIVQDHDSRRAWLVHAGFNSEPEGIPPDALPSQLTPAALGPRFAVTSAVGSEVDYAQYADAIERILKYIRDGDCYQVNYTQQFSARAEGDPWDAFQRLRDINPAPYSAYLEYPWGAVLSSSPEQFLKVCKNEVTTRPIKGTRPRRADPEADAAERASLLASEKDRAENVMIVDLLRNDLGKSCAVGSVSVPKLFALESFAKVHHLVSNVTGMLAPDQHVVDLLRGCFPGGSITGAPKRRAMEIIEELEPTRRSVYCGAIGYISFCGDMDTNIAIRTMLFADGWLRCWAGGGIVFDSVAADEYQESLDKAAAMLEVFAASQRLGLSNEGS